MLAKKPTGVYRDPNSLNFGQAEGRIKRIFSTYTISKHQEPSTQMLNGRKAHKNLKEIRYLIALDKSKISSPPPTTPHKKQCSKKCNTMVIDHNVAYTQQNRLNALNHKTRDTSQVQVFWTERVKFSRKCLTHLPVFLIPEASTFMQFE